MKSLGIITAATASIALRFTVKGYVFSVLWRWFVVPAFEIVPLGVATAAGIICAVDLLTPTRPKRADDPPFDESLKRATAGTIVGSAAALFIGWIIRFFL